MKTMEEKYEKLEELAIEKGQEMWSWFEENLIDSNIYPGDAVHEDYIEIMSESQINDLYNFLTNGD